MIKVVSWNVGKMYQPLEELLAMNDTDVALLQEVGAGMRDHLSAAGGPIATSPHDPWEPAPKSDYDRWPLVVKLSDRVEIEWFRQVRATIPREDNDEIAVSCGGTIAAAKVNPLEGGEPFIAVSMYARWFTPHPTTGSRYIYSDTAAHHIISDLTTFTGPTHPVLAAGDLNNIYGATRDSRLVWYERDRTVFDRMVALGLEFVGPQSPDGRQAQPTPQGLPEPTGNVATFYTSGNSPATAENQLDYVFASRGFHNSVRTRAVNGVDEWGSSDHCRILIEVGDRTAS